MWQMPPVLAERVTETDAQARAVGTKIASAEDAARLFRAAIPIAGNREGFFVLPLDAEKRVLAAPMLVSLGHEDGTTVIDAGAIFREALKAGAEEIIVAHNHPSGDPTPSKPDIVTTAKLREAGAMLGVPLIDHLILGAASSGGRHGFISLAEYKEKK
jgi:DNA repair protein RadC